ncbi:MAG: hypothetical protein D6707_07270 [Bacteroidetes bacterium]|nr:MAG: hypothetical protein D6707_07270 [Bacteroidota bacterium]
MSYLEEEWNNILNLVEKNYGTEPNIEAILLLIGIQELGKIPPKLSKDQKLDVMHIAVCKLLEPYGFYEYKGKDEDGWPHWERTRKLPAINPEEQQELLKQCIVDYFKNVENQPNA